jgi:hypothetical protein
MGLLTSSHRDLHVSGDQIYKRMRPLIRINKGNQNTTQAAKERGRHKCALIWRATRATRNAGNNVVQIPHLSHSSYGEAFADGVQRRILTCSPASQRRSVLMTTEFQQPGSDVLCTLYRQQAGRLGVGMWCLGESCRAAVRPE